MSGVVTVTHQQFGQAVLATARRVQQSIRMAPMAAARKYASYLMDQVDALDITDQGIFKNSIRAEKTPNGATTYSDAPHAGIIELGTRPHPVSEEGRISIARWAMRKLGLDEQEAMRAAFLIARKISKVGQKAHYLFRDSLDVARRFFDEEFARLLRREAFA